MAIKKSFGGASIRKPGVYSISKVSDEAGSPLTSNNTIMVIGESDAGPGGSEDGIQAFSASAYNQLVAKYKAGPIVDAAKASLAPSKSPGINGAGRILVYKTNASVQASLALANSYGTIKDLEYGVGGNRITYKNVLSDEGEISVEGSAAVTNFAGLNGLTLEIAFDGGAKSTCTFSSPVDINDVLSQIDAAISGVTSSESSGVLKITRDAGSDIHRDGIGRSMEIVGGTALGDLFLSAELAIPAAEPQASIEIIQPRDGITESNTIGGEIAMEIGRDGSGSVTACDIDISDSSLILNETGGSTITLSFEDYPLIRNLVEAISALTGFSVSAGSAYKNLPSTALDNASSVGCFSENGEKAGRLKIDSYRMAELIGDSSLVEIESQSDKGLPDAEGPSNLSGGLRGASASSAFEAGFAAALAEDIKAFVPCIAQDAADDILAGLTDASSSYDIETVHAMLDTHLRLRGNIKNKKEAQGYVGYRKAAKADVFEQAGVLGSAEIQICMLDVLVVDSSGQLVWKQPYIEAALYAGMRLGTEVGEPLTYKFLNCNGSGHYVNSSTGKVEGDFDALIDYDEAIDAGVTFNEPYAGGFRCVIDNTSYGQDDSFVFNRGSVVEASQYIAQQVRSDADSAFVGRKNAVVTANAIKSRIRTKLIQLFNDKVTSPSEDAPQGYREDTFIVEVVGNTATVQVECKPVQGLDFIFITFTLGETRQSA